MFKFFRTTESERLDFMKALRTCLTTLIVILTCGIAVHSQLNCSGGPLNCNPPLTVLLGGTGTTTSTGSGNSVLSTSPSLTTPSIAGLQVTGLYSGNALAVFGDGTASQYNDINYNGAATANYGSRMAWQSGGVDYAYIARAGRIDGGTSNNLYIRTTGTTDLRLGVNGADAITINGTTQVVTLAAGLASGTTVNSASATGAFNVNGTTYITGLTAESGTKSTLCLDPVTMQVETNAAATCTVSNLQQKDWIADLSCKEARKIVKGMRPAMFKDKDGADGPRFGFAAEWTATNDKRLVYFDKGKPHAVDYERYTAVLTRVLQCSM